MQKLTHSEILNQRLTNEQAHSISRHPISLMLYNIRSLYNVGSLFRTADSALAQELILCGYTPHPPRKEIEKTALGAVDSVPWYYEQNALSAVRELKEKKVCIFALELADNCRSYDSLTADDFPCCLILGNEITGVDNEILAECDGSLIIPMYGVKHSLNVSVAGGIAIYEAVRIWRNLQKDS